MFDGVTEAEKPAELRSRNSAAVRTRDDVYSYRGVDELARLNFILTTGSEYLDHILMTILRCPP